VPETDGQLVRRALAGDGSAFAELERRHRPAVARLASRLMDTPEDAEDMAQEALLRAWLRLGELREPERFRGWLLTVARSVCAEAIRTRALRRTLADGAPVAFEPLPLTPEEETWRRETAREMRELVERLPEPHRVTARRYYLDEHTQAEVAGELGVAVGTVKARLHHARRMMEVSRMNRQWYGELDPPAQPGQAMAWEDLARRTLAAYDLGELRGLGSTVEPSASMAIGIETETGRYRLWRYSAHHTPELVELQHAMLQHLDAKGVPVKRLVPARDGSTWREVGGRLVAVFEWFSGRTADLCDQRDLAGVAALNGRWTAALADFDPPIAGWRELASAWRPRKLWAWSLPMHELPDVPRRMGFMAAVRDVEDPPEHHARLLEQVADIEARLPRFAERSRELGMAELPRGLNHGVFLFGQVDWEPMVTDADDFVHEARIADLGRLLFAIHDREMPDHRVDEAVMLAVETYREHVGLAPEELRALPFFAWAMLLYYDVFHVLLYLHEQDGPDRGEYLVTRRMSEWTAIRDRFERRFEQLSRVLAGT